MPPMSRAHIALSIVGSVWLADAVCIATLTFGSDYAGPHPTHRLLFVALTGALVVSGQAVMHQSTQRRLDELSDRADLNLAERARPGVVSLAERNGARRS